METKLQFKSFDVDDVSSIPNAHLSFIVQNLLPVRLVGRHKVEMLEDTYLQMIAKEDEDTVSLPVGSLAEGLNMPHVIVRKSGEEIHGGSYTDLDILIIMKKCPVTFDTSRMHTGKYYALAETSEVHPGYARLNMSSSAEKPLYKDRERTQLQMQEHAISKAEKPTLYEINGPALTNLREPLTKSSCRSASADRIPSTDQVIAFPCAEWPPAATKWITRYRNQDWLSRELVDSFVQDGCHFVPVSHKFSKASTVEWRVSFAATERRIAREIITDEQRQVYIFIKILYHQTLKPIKILSSYHLKTIFLYACEMIPSIAWKENLGSCIFFILDLLVECTTNRTLPNFFVPENNLFDYFADDELNKLHKTVMELRFNPLAAALQFTDDILVGQASVRHSPRELFESVLLDMTNFIGHKDIRKSVLEAFIPTSHKLLLAQLGEGKSDEAVHIASKLHSMLIEHKLSEETLGEFCFWNIACHMTDGRQTVAFIEKLIEMHEGDSDFDCCRDNLACMCHAAAYRFPEGSAEHKDYLRKSEAVFLSRFANQEVSGGYCDYAWLLLKQKRYDEAIVWLDQVIQSNNKDLCNLYDAGEIMTLDETLQNEIAEHNQFSSSSISIAYYLKNECLVKKKETPDNTITCLLRNFKCFAEKDNLPRTYALLGYSYIAIQDWKSASDAFEHAIASNKNAEYTMAIKMKKYCDEKQKSSIS